MYFWRFSQTQSLMKQCLQNHLKQLEKCSEDNDIFGATYWRQSLTKLSIFYGLYILGQDLRIMVVIIYWYYHIYIILLLWYLFDLFKYLFLFDCIAWLLSLHIVNQFVLCWSHHWKTFFILDLLQIFIYSFKHSCFRK